MNNTHYTSTFKLEPMGRCSVKSHYGRAQVCVFGNTGVYGLLSYGYLVAAGTMANFGAPGQIFRIWCESFEYGYGGWSKTTAKHLESFAAFLGTEYGGKKSWTDKEYKTIEEVIALVEGGNDQPTPKAA